MATKSALNRGSWQSLMLTRTVPCAAIVFAWTCLTDVMFGDTVEWGQNAVTSVFVLVAITVADLIARRRDQGV